MTLTPPTSVPAILIAGDSWDFTLEFVDYPITDGWSTLEVYFRGVGSFTLDAADITNDGTKIIVQTDPADSATLPAGRYEWFARVIGAGAVAGQEKVAGRGTTLIRSNPETAVAGDLPTDNEKILALIVAETKARITGTGSAHDSIVIDGFQLSKINFEQLEKLERKYQARVAAERQAGRSGPSVAFVL